MADQGAAIVTGGAKGIGRAVSLELARQGHDVIVTGRDQAALDRAVGEIQAEAKGIRVAAVPMDVADDASIRAGFAAAQEVAPVTVLVNNAGVIIRKPAEELDDQEWSHVVETDLGGVFRCARAAFPLLRKQGGGAVVNVSSIAAFLGMSGHAGYTASKAGVVGLTRTLALEWAPYGIRVNAVAPGWTRTAMVETAITAGEVNGDAVTARIPLGRMARPEEIADAVAYLASPKASYITGQTLVVDGGISINGNP